mmetsp:Transcript_54691/g.132810  ORF Transcript_54691/g.132810 Transcript_54691/m.132810 type:complete len:249 (-) Transcript_54691:435-1181(-)
MDLEANLPEGLVVQQQSAIVQEGRLFHVVVDAFVIQRFELVPFRQDTDRVRTLACLVRVRRRDDRIVESWGVVVVDIASVVHLDPHILPCHLWVVDVDLSTLLEEVPDDEHGRSLTDVAGVLLEGITQDGDLLTGNGVEHGRHDLHRKTLLLEVVHGNDLTPVLGTFVKTVRLAQVDQVQDVLLETRTSKPDGGHQEPFADTVVHTDGTADFRDVCTGRLTQRRDGVNRRHTLCQEGVRDEFRQLRRP